MHFRLEKEMQNVALEQLPLQLEIKSSYAFAREIPLNYKVADLGFAPFSDKEFDFQLWKGLLKLGSKDLWSIANWIIREKVEYTAKTEKLINYLIKREIIDLKNSDSLIISAKLVGNLGPLYMVELKMSRWQQALKQAIFYKKMAEYSAVVLDENFISKVSLDDFRDNGIGLFAASSESIEVVVKPIWSDVLSIQQKMFNRLNVLKDLSRKRPQKWEMVKTENGPSI